MDDEATGGRSAPVARSEDLLVRTPAQFKALGHPLRHRIVNVLRQRPATLGELASALDGSKGTIGYHLRVLREAGLVRLAHTRQVRGGTEQSFDLVSAVLRLDTGAVVGAEFLINAALTELAPAGDDEVELTVLRHVFLTREEAKELVGRIEELAARPYRSDGSRGHAYGLLLSLHRTDSPTLPAGEEEDV
ncbi:helix-turn-helix domain-containing protein [Actinopolymorpha pittospori]|uniref:DNA-binding transcriptional ArsR family regulator n=1 Tax=Actinopolymorpha pittospori TaxID=648752 RepID=A0A927MYF2_9ACTN|nr:DNA-binding transcriptional ArsR family regulator [Actinopolymorpha pittospori]